MDPDKKQNKRRIYNKKWMSEKRRKVQLLTQRKQSKFETDFESFQCLNVSQDVNSLEDMNVDVPICDDQSDCSNTLSEGSISSGRLDLNFSAFVPSTDEESDNNDKQTELIDTLREWVNLNEVKATTVDDLLKRLRKTVNPNLPASSRTLLKTPRNIDLLRVSNMDYFILDLN